MYSDGISGGSPLRRTCPAHLFESAKRWRKSRQALEFLEVSVGQKEVCLQNSLTECHWHSVFVKQASAAKHTSLLTTSTQEIPEPEPLRQDAISL